MALLHIPIADIDERQLQRLIDGRAPESREIDYKSALYGGKDAMDEWLADASSFANTVGGDLIFGMTEAKGVPTGFAPLAEADLDKVSRDLQQSADTGLQPRLPALRFKPSRAWKPAHWRRAPQPAPARPTLNRKRPWPSDRFV